MDTRYVLMNPAVKIRWIRTPQKEIIQAVHSITEKTFSLNKKTLNLLELCNGTRSCREIAAEFKKTHPQTEPQSILKALETLSEKGVILRRESPSQSSIMFSCAELEYPVKVVTLEITSKCSLRCLHCYNDSGPHRTQFYSLEEMNCIVDKLDTLHVGRISLSGGEPLLHPHFFDIVAMMKERNIPWSIFSNGVLIDEEMAKNLVDNGIRKVTTSLDGSTAKSHDFLRGVKGSFQKTVHAIKILREYEVPLEVHCTLHRNNVKEIPDVLKLLNSLGVNKYALVPLRSLRPQKIDKKRDKENEPGRLTLTMDDFVNMLPEIVRAEYDIFGTSQFVPDPDPDCINCGGGTSRFMIYSDGRMVCCPQSDPDFFTFGNVLKDDIREAWNTAEVLQKMRSFNFKSIKECSPCTYQAYCNGGCPVAKYELYCDAYVLDPYTCRTLEAVQSYLDISGK